MKHRLTKPSSYEPPIARVRHERSSFGLEPPEYVMGVLRDVL
jgi:hypothetical protein